MKNIKFAMFSAMAAMMISGCISYSYEGKKSEPAKKIDDVRVFNSVTEIKRSYTVLGTATVSAYTQDVSRDRMIAKLRSEAQKNGADAVIVTDQQIVSVNSDSGAQPFTTAFDYDDSSQNWREIYRDIDQNFTNPERSGHNHVNPGAARRIIYAKFIKFDTDGK
ncbi:MAG: hypothetical protein E7054_06470 [Lentisphaerae bacterium]|nr:hypothetical protein [Lentisphaerota bacterium]